MKIQRISQIGAAGMGMLFMLAIGIGAYDVNLIRIGGSLHNQEQAAAELLADTMPPTLSTADPYLIASKVMLGTISAGEAERTFQNDRRNYEERKAAAEKNEFLPEDVQDGFVREVFPSSDRFWDELQNNFIPAAKSGNADAARASFNRLTRLENENEVVIGRVGSKLLKADEEIEAKASIRAFDVLTDHVSAIKGQAEAPADGAISAELEAIAESDGTEEAEPAAPDPVINETPSPVVADDAANDDLEIDFDDLLADLNAPEPAAGGHVTPSGRERATL